MFMKILSWDVNGLGARIEAVKRLAQELKPDLICVQKERVNAWDGVSTRNAGCFYKWEHDNFDSMMKAVGLIDSYRYLHSEGRDYSYFFQNRPEYRIENKGFRIDYFLVSEELIPYVKKSEILTDVFDTTNSPILLEIEMPKYLSLWKKKKN